MNLNLHKKAIRVALAYVGIIVGAGLSSGQDLIQYFVSFGYQGIWGVVILAILNIIFGKIIIATGCYYHSDSHEEVLAHIAHPITKRILDITLIVAGFVIGFVMIAGAGSNLEQQFGLPVWMGGLLCTVMIIVVSFLDIDRIMNVLGVFTPVLIVMILVITAWTFIGHNYDYTQMDQIARTIPSALPNIWVSVINYYSLCALTGVSMAFILGGSLVRIKVAREGGVIGGILIGLIILCATLVLFARINVVKDADIPMLVLVKEINPYFAVAYALVIFGLIFNTAFSLFYSLAVRLAKSNREKAIIYMAVLAFSGYVLSFVGFKELISVLYPILGYLGIVLLVVLLRNWLTSQQEMKREQKLRTKMFRLARKKVHPQKKMTREEAAEYQRLAEDSAADTESIKKDIEQEINTALQQTDSEQNLS